MKVSPDLSIVVPARDEEENVEPLVSEIESVFVAKSIAFELVVVDDGSKDGTASRLASLAASRDFLTAVRFTRPEGKTAALRQGFLVARAAVIATLDADLQNDPADLPSMLALIHAGEADFVQGRRTRRADGLARRAAAGVGRLARRAALGDVTSDTGCATRVLTAALARSLPLHLEGMHRFLPHLARQEGARVVEVPVGHRPRRAGKGHYGILTRGAAGFLDLLAVRWMTKRRRSPSVRPL